MGGKRWKNGFDTRVLLKYAERLDAVGDSAALQRAVEAGMITAKRSINAQITAAMAPANLPAGGKYSTGKTLDSLDQSTAVQWDGNTATLPVGFDMEKSGVTSILLMYGTPKMAPVPGLADALYGKKAQAQARKAQEAAILKVLERLGG